MVETIDGYEKLRELLSAEMAKAIRILDAPDCTLERALEIQRWAASLEKAQVKNRLRAERGFRRLLREMNQPQPRRARKLVHRWRDRQRLPDVKEL